MNRMNPKVDGYIRKTKHWHEELQKLRSIILDCGLTEEVKWRVPCYTFQESNVLFVGRFKESCVLSFVKGVLLKDARGFSSSKRRIRSRCGSFGSPMFNKSLSWN